MKSKLFLLAAVISIGLRAQNTIQIQIYNITPTTVCAGDSIKVDFQFFNCNTTGGFQLMPSLDILYQAGCLNLGNLPMETVGTYTCYYKRMRIPLTASIGTHSIYATGQTSYTYPFSHSILVTNCATGIQENNYELEEAPIYFDLSGNRINKKAGELIIEQVGIRRKKIFIN